MPRRYILIAEDNLHVRLIEYIETLHLQKSCISYAVALLACSVSLAIGWEQLGDFLRPVFLAGAILASFHLAKDLCLFVKHHKENDVESFIKSMRGKEVETNKTIEELVEEGRSYSYV